jgi:DNA-binding MarR family transcriptional regulator
MPNTAVPQLRTKHPDPRSLRADLLILDLTRSEHHLALFLWSLWSDGDPREDVVATWTQLAGAMRATRQSVARWAAGLERKGAIEVEQLASGYRFSIRYGAELR